MEYFKDSDFFTPNEAAFRWNMKRNTIIAALNRGRFDNQLEEGSIKKFSLQGSPDWYISAKAMRDVFGDEEKVQVFESWSKVGDERKPKKFVHFNKRPVYQTVHGEDVSEDLLDGLREFDDFESAYKFALEFRKG